VLRCPQGELGIVAHHHEEEEVATVGAEAAIEVARDLHAADDDLTVAVHPTHELVVQDLIHRGVVVGKDRALPATKENRVLMYNLFLILY